jgi:hypothetical protein
MDDDLAALLADRAAMAERVAGLERERDRLLWERNEQNGVIATRLKQYLARAEAAEAEVARLREALGPFAVEADEWDEMSAERPVIFMDSPVTVAHFRAARAALTRPDET